MSHNDLETVITYEEDRALVMSVKEKYQGEICSRLWCRKLAKQMFAPFADKFNDPEYYFPVVKEIEDVTITEANNDVITLSKGEVSLDFYMSANLTKIIVEIGVNLPKTEGLSYGEKLEVVHCYLRPFSKQLEKYFTLE